MRRATAQAGQVPLIAHPKLPYTENAHLELTHEALAGIPSRGKNDVVNCCASIELDRDPRPWLQELAHAEVCVVVHD